MAMLLGTRTFLEVRRNSKSLLPPPSVVCGLEEKRDEVMRFH
jgi:hypothetical protein